MAGSAAFLAPLTRIVPSSGLPPRITNLSIRPSILMAKAEKRVREIVTPEDTACGGLVRVGCR